MGIYYAKIKNLSSRHYPQAKSKKRGNYETPKIIFRHPEFISGSTSSSSGLIQESSINAVDAKTSSA